MCRYAVRIIPKRCPDVSGISVRMRPKYAIGLGGSIDTKRLRCLFRLNQQSKLTSVTLKNSNLGTSVIRTRSITATSIESVVPSLDDYAQICTTAEGYSYDKTATDENSFNGNNEKVRRYVGFSRGRISQARGNYALLCEYLAWLEQLNQILNSNNKPLSVFSRYAKEIKAPKNTKPKNLLLDITDIKDFYLTYEGKPIEIEDICIEVEPNGSIEFYANGDKLFGGFAFNSERNRYELDSVDFGERYHPNSNEYPSNIINYINQHQTFRVIPQSRGTVYVNGHFYQPTIKVGSEFDSNNYALGNCFITDEIIGAIKSEKGDKVINNGKHWELSSLFGIIDSLGQGTAIESIIGQPDIIVCDDMGKEAADFFICNTSKETPSVILIHAKASKDIKECSASSLHDICSQAVKNLCYLAMFNREKPTHVKTKMWEKSWNAPNIGHINERIRRGTGTSAELWQQIQDTINNPMVQKEVWLMLGQILSRKAFEEKLGESTPPAEALQAVYLLQATMVEVAAVGARLRIICSP